MTGLYSPAGASLVDIYLKIRFGHPRALQTNAMPVLLYCTRCMNALTIAYARSVEDITRTADEKGWSSGPRGWSCPTHGTQTYDLQAASPWNDEQKLPPQI